MPNPREVHEEACPVCGSRQRDVRGTLYVAGLRDRYGDGETHYDCDDRWHDAKGGDDADT